MMSPKASTWTSCTARLRLSAVGTRRKFDAERLIHRRAISDSHRGKKERLGNEEAEKIREQRLRRSSECRGG